MATHPGFKAVQSKIEKEGYSARAAGAILAKKTREASPAAKKKNPRLKRVAAAKPSPLHKQIASKMLDTDKDGY